MLTSREVTFFVHGLPDDPFIEKLRDRLMADIVDSKPVVTPFPLGPIDSAKALVGKYMW